MILESIVTTMAPDGQVNIAPMGPVVGNPDAMRVHPCESHFSDDAKINSDALDPQFLLRPFEGSRTYANLDATRRATIHVTDDSELFATTAVGKIQNPSDWVRFIELPTHSQIQASASQTPAGWPILKHCHRWFAVEIETVTGRSPRFEMTCRVVHSGMELPFFGFNRAAHAVIEASILATRTHLLEPDEIRRQVDALRPLVDKTAGHRERRAFALVDQAITNRLAGLRLVQRESPNELKEIDSEGSDA